MVNMSILSGSLSLNRLKGLYRKSPKKFVVIGSSVACGLILILVTGSHAAIKTEGVKVVSRDPQTTIENMDQHLDSMEYFHIQTGSAGTLAYTPSLFSPEKKRPVTFLRKSPDPGNGRKYKFPQSDISRRIRPLVIDLSLNSGAADIWPRANIRREMDDEENMPPGGVYYLPPEVNNGYPSYYVPFYPGAGYVPNYPVSGIPSDDDAQGVPLFNPDEVVAASGTPVPLPSAISLFMGGIMGLFALRSRAGNRQK
ncbi:MAG: hypothetical protein KJ737_22675 [Proteobacteria bacterium]|nr:hypothetical protein [Pseudomonadota bacterium]